ncbi:hypothetical protein T492DRAFT_859710 [Pavlovales sp. CCMP2436]|nr:hypothetical protein T492DRAFT_859710 [Pavlovales sp. CCMP2436]
MRILCERARRAPACARALLSAACALHGFNPAAGLACLVTGGTGGIGAELVAELASRGHLVAFTARSAESARGLEARVCRAVGPGRAVHWPLDLRRCRAGDFERLLDDVEHMLAQPVALVVNNAAVCEPGHDARAYARALRVNAAAPAALGAAALARMRRRGFGRVVNVSSGDGERVYLHSSVLELLDRSQTLAELSRGVLVMLCNFDTRIEYAHGPTPAYSWSKALLNRATQLGAMEIGEGEDVLLNAACPGDVLTAMMTPGVDPTEARSPAEAAASLLMAAFLDEAATSKRNGLFLRDGSPIAF